MSGHSVCLHVSWRFQRFYGYIERLAQNLRHIVIKPKSGDESGFPAKFPIGSNSGPVGGEYNYVLASPKSCPSNAIDGKLFPIGQINENVIDVSRYHQPIPPLDERIMRASKNGVQRS